MAPSGAFHKNVPEMTQASRQPWGIGAAMRAGLSNNPMICLPFHSSIVFKARSHPPSHIDSTLVFEVESVPIREMKKTGSEKASGMISNATGFKPRPPDASIFLASSLAVH